jgi:hypothetical protein
MRFACFVVLFSLSSAAVAQPDAPMSAQQAYRTQLAAQCPAKHLDWVSPADLFDLLEDYSGNLPQKIRHDMTRAEARRCAGSPGGASCPNAAVLEVAQRHHLISQIAAQTCSHFSICRDQSDCDAVSSGSEEPDSEPQVTAVAR